MRYRKFGKFDLEVSEIGFGAWAIGGPTQLGPVQTGWGQVDDNVSLHTLQTCLELGINFIDTSDAYGNGHSEMLVGKAFKNHRQQMIICSKGGNRTTPEGKWVKDFSAEWMTQACEASLKRLQTDYIDIYLFHTPKGELQFVAEEFDVLKKLKAAGKIRYFGISVNTAEDGLKVLAGDCAEAMQVLYNLINREAERDVLPQAQKAGVGIIDRVPLASGFLTGKFGTDVTFEASDHRSRLSSEVIKWRIEQAEKLKDLFAGDTRTLAQLALQFCLSNSAVSVVIPGAKTPDQLRQNAMAGQFPPLTTEELAQINKIFPVGL